MNGRLMLVDSASLYFRAFFGVKESITAPDGTPVNAVRGFLDMLATLITRRRPVRLVACWDDDWRPAFRVAAIPSYKAHRLAPTQPSGGPDVEITPDALDVQVPIIAAALEVLGIARLGGAGLEADDVMGTLTTREVRRAHAAGATADVDVVTGDRDLFQLVDDALAVRVLYTAKGGVRDAEIVDQSVLIARYAVPTGDAYADLAVLRGDASDGLPGVAGIGEKTAAALLATYGSLDGIRTAVDGGDPRIKGAKRARLEAGAAYLDVAPGVVRVAVDAPVPDVDLRLPTRVADPALMSRLAVDYGLTNPFNRVLGALGLG